MKKSFKLYIIAWLAALALFNVITFVTPNEINGVSKFDTLFWIAYAAITACFIAQFLTTLFTTKTGSLQKVFYFYNFPLLRISVIALLVMLIVGGLCMAIIQIPDWIGIIICCIVLAVNIIAYSKASIAVDTISAIDQKIKTKTFFIKSLTVDAQTLTYKAQTDDMRALVRNVYEAIRYSDPMSDSALGAVENKITAEFENFAKFVSENDLSAAKNSCNELLTHISERNMKCKILK